jgi:hypothetical protein
MRIEFYVPFLEKGSLALRSLIGGAMFSRLQLLSITSYASPWSHTHTQEPPDTSFALDMLRSCSGSLRLLTWSCFKVSRFNNNLFHPMLDITKYIHLFSALEILETGIALNKPISSGMSLNAVHLPRLHTLLLDGCQSIHAWTLLSWVSDWNLPSLASVALFGLDPNTTLEYGMIFLKKQGEKLRVLHMPCPCQDRVAQSTHFLDYCPNLEHLIAYDDIFYPCTILYAPHYSLSKITARLPRRLDVCTRTIAQMTFPKLAVVRLLGFVSERNHWLGISEETVHSYEAARITLEDSDGDSIESQIFVGCAIGDFFD